MELKVKVDNKKVFNRIGLAIFVSMILVNIIQVIFFGIIGVVNQELLSAPWINYAGIAISFYLIGFPVFYLMIKNLPEEEKRESKTLGVFEVIKICFMSYSIVYIVNFLTNILMMLIAVIKGSEVTNPLVNMLEGSNWIWSLIFAGILSPIIEEMMFRGVMLNKLRRYGDKVAIITTAILFGLFHANFSQFFYAVALGIVFAYVTLKTGTIKYSIILHIIVNMMGSVILPAVIGDGSNIVAVGCVGLALLAIVIVGLVLLIKNRKNISLLDGEIKLEKGTAFKTIWVNVGMILYVVISLVSMISILFM
ncbi:MAG: type II CAAX endopeptidase family protein [uncultured Clostridium sp.]